MRTQHATHQLKSFPIYSAAFLAPDRLVIGGGGGTGRTGIKNKLRLYKTGTFEMLELLDEFELAKDEDAPMSMAAWPESKTLVCGVNSAADKLEKGENENCRAFSVAEDKLVMSGTKGTLTGGDIEDYQKVTVISPDGALVAVAGTKDLSLLTYPFLQPTASPIHVSQGEIYDIAFSNSTLVVATTVNLLVYSLTASEKGKERASASLSLTKTVERPALPGNFAGSSFRAARFPPNDDKVLYTVVNTVPPRARTKGSLRVAYVIKWDTESWKPTKIRKIGEKGATCFDVSPNGAYLAYGSSDLSVGVLDANTLAPLLNILNAHDFPPTCIRFSPASNLLVTGSADNTVRLVSVPENFTGASWQSFGTAIVMLLVVLIAILAQRIYTS